MTGERCVRCQAAKAEHGIPSLPTCRRYLVPGGIGAWWWRRHRPVVLVVKRGRIPDEIRRSLPPPTRR